ncbi:sugar ABC transporter permease [Leptolyngbya sp. 15MV]|nr:sugar ABC transporter permease [Leptolyngbya sp. 15MV]
MGSTGPQVAPADQPQAAPRRRAQGRERFHTSAWLQVKLSVATVTLQLLMGLGIALLLNHGGFIRRFARTLFLIPMVLPPIAVGILWRVMFTVDISPMHRFAAWIGLPIPPLTTDPDFALWAIVVVDTWEWFPFTMLMVLAALQMIPDSPVEAAKIDGASDVQLFRYVLLPYIAPTLVVAGLFRLIDSIKAFPLIYVLTSGGPGDATTVTNYYAFVQAFNFSLWGYASAIATLMVLAIFLLSWLIDRLTGATDVRSA